MTKKQAIQLVDHLLIQQGISAKIRRKSARGWCVDTYNGRNAAAKWVLTSYSAYIPGEGDKPIKDFGI